MRVLTPMRALELRIPPVLLGFGLGMAMLVAARFLPFLEVTLPGQRVLAAGLGSVGATVALLGVLAFRRAHTTVNPLQPAASTQLVVSGVYRLTRNPMYLGFLLMLAGWGVFLGHPGALAIASAFIPLMNRLQIRPEEEILAAKFGADFAAYQAKVRRWL